MCKRLFFVPLGLLWIAALACGSGTGPTPTASGPKVLLKDDFSKSDSGWVTGADSQSSVEYDQEEYVVKISDTGLLVWGTADEDNLAEVHVVVQARNVGSATDPTFGIVCHYQDDQNFYYMGIGADGFYAIAKYENDQLTILTDKDNQWIQSDKIKRNAAAYTLEADCGGGRLTLYVDGTRIDSVEEASFSQGRLGLFARSFDAAGVEVHFDNFVATELK